MQARDEGHGRTHLLGQPVEPERLLFCRSKGGHTVGKGPPYHKVGVWHQHRLQGLVHALRHPHLREAELTLALEELLL